MEINVKLFKLIAYCLLLSLFFNSEAEAAKLSLSSSPTSVGFNTEFVVSIYIDTQSEQVNAAAAFMTYNSNHVTALSIDSNGSAFPIAASESIAASSLSIERGSITSVNSGSALLAKVRFRSLSSSLQTTINLATGSSVIRASDAVDVLVSTTPVQITITPPQSTPSTPPPSPAPQSAAPAPQQNTQVQTPTNTSVPTASTNQSAPPSNTSEATNNPVAEEVTTQNFDTFTTPPSNQPIENTVVENEQLSQKYNSYLNLLLTSILLLLLLFAYLRRSHLTWIHRHNPLNHLKRSILKGYNPAGKTISEIENDLKISKKN